MRYGSLSRRRFLALSGAATAGTLLGGSQWAAAPSLAAEPVTLTFWAPGSGKWCQNLNGIGQGFTKLHPTIHVDKVMCGAGSQDFLTLLLTRIAAGNPPDATVAWNSPASLGVQGALLPLDDLMAKSPRSQAKNWPSGVLASCQWNGKTYGLPATAGAYALWYNQDWFEAKGIPSSRDKFPKTWDDLRKLSKEFTHWQGGKLVSAGYIPMNDIDLIDTLYIWPRLNGGDIYDARKRTYVIDSEANVATMQYMLDWLNEEYRGDMAAVSKSGNWSGGGNGAAFQNGRLAMMAEGSWQLSNIMDGAKYKKYNLASFPIGPGGATTTAGYGPNWLVIPRGSHHVEEAFTWLDYLGSTGMREWFSQVPDLPANKTVAADLLPDIVVKTRGKAFAADVTRFLRHQLDISGPLFDSPVQSFATDQMLKTINRIMRKVAKPKVALAEAQRACQTQLEAARR